MGVVYRRARHAMLRRPTAVKLLDPRRARARSRLRARGAADGGLAHPNTIAIYDYGRTPEGVFYYAMGLLEA